MKKSLFALLLLACASTVQAWDVEGYFSWPDDTSRTLTYIEVNDVQDIAITHVYSNKNYKEVTSWNEQDQALTDVWEGFSPDSNVGQGKSWTLTFTIFNTNVSDSMIFEAITLQAVLYDGDGQFQPSNTPRNITFTLGVKDGETLGTVSQLMDGSGINTDASRAENVTETTITLDRPLEIAANSSVTLTLTASPMLNASGGNASGGSTHVGVKGAVLQFVPEPTTTTLSLLALAGMAVRRRRH